MDLATELSLLKERLNQARKGSRDKSLSDLAATASEKGLIASNACNVKIKTRSKLKGHASKVYALYWAHDPQFCQLLSASQDSTLILWDTCSRRKLRAIDLSCAWTMTCATSRPPAANEICASAGMDGVVSVYSLIDRQSVDSGRLVRELLGHDGFIASIDFVHGSKQILSASADATCRLWDVVTGSCASVFRGHQSEIYCMATNKEDRFVTGSADRSIKLWDIRDGRVCLTIPDVHDADVNSVAFFPSGYAVASGSDDCTAKLVDLRAAQVLSCLNVPPSVEQEQERQKQQEQQQQQPVKKKRREHRFSVPIRRNSPKLNNMPVSKSTDDVCHQEAKVPGSVPITSLDFSSSGRLLFCGCDNFDCVVFDSMKSTILAWLHGHENRIQCTSVERRGLALATGSWDSTIRIWN